MTAYDDDVITHPVCGEWSAVGHEDPNLVILSRASRLKQLLPQIHQRHLHTHTQGYNRIYPSNIYYLMCSDSCVDAELHGCVLSCLSCYTCSVCVCAQECETDCTGHIEQNRTTETGTTAMYFFLTRFIFTAA